MILYATPKDHILHHEYKMLAPAYAAIQHPLVLEGVIEPLYQPFDIDEMETAHKTIEDLANYIKDKVPFEFTKEFDLIEVYNYINCFLNESEIYYQQDDFKELAFKLINLKVELERGRKMIFNDKTHWAEEILILNNSAMKLLDLFTFNEEGYLQEKINQEHISMYEKILMENDTKKSKTFEDRYNVYDGGL